MRDYFNIYTVSIFWFFCNIMTINGSKGPLWFLKKFVKTLFFEVFLDWISLLVSGSIEGVDV